MPKTIEIPGRKFFNEQTEKFITVKDTTLVLEHSLISISKWEAIWKKPFLKEGSMSTTEETLSYIECMTVHPQNPDPIVYKCITQAQVMEIVEYINDPMTATWFSDDKKKKSKRAKEIQTSEVIYWQMTVLQIPIDVCQKWHLNRLLTLIRVCNAKNDPENDKKKMTPQERMALNKSRIAKSKAAAKRPPARPHK